MRTHYGPWQPCWISNQHQNHKSGRGPSNEHFWQVWLKSVLRCQRRFKCEKLTDGQRTLTHDKSAHGLWPGELKKNKKKPDTHLFTLWPLVWKKFTATTSTLKCNLYSVFMINIFNIQKCLQMEDDDDDNEHDDRPITY